MKKAYILLAVAAVCLTLSACHKTCTCVGYDGMVHEFTPEEVSERAGGNCSYMSDFPVENRYSYCHW